jgi:hypothetical protein
MQGPRGAGCRSREERRPGNTRRGNDGRCAVDLDHRHTVQLAHSEDQSKSGILAPAFRKALRRAEILPRLIVIPHAAACRGAKYIPSFCAVRISRYFCPPSATFAASPSHHIPDCRNTRRACVLDRLEMLVRNVR